MPTRNVTVRLHVPREGETADLVEGHGTKNERHRPLRGAEVLRAIVRTHVVANLGAQYYCGRLRWMLREAPETEGKVGKAARDLVLSMIEGDATKASNASRGLYRPLTDPKSKGAGFGAATESAADGTRRRKLLDELLEKPEIVERDEVRRLVVGGRPPGWVEKAETDSGFRARDPWSDALQAKLEASVKKARGGEETPQVVLKRAKWLEAGSDKLLVDLPGRLGGPAELGYGAFAQAASRLAQHQSWKERRQGERESQQKKLSERYGALAGTEPWKALERYEEESRRHYEKVSGNPARGEYRLGDGGELKGWDRIRKSWLKRRWAKTEPTEEDLRQARIEEQKRRPEEHGDHRLFDWLAQKEQWFLWDGREASEGEREGRAWDYVSLRRAYNRDRRPLKGIDFSWPDPLRHPLWQPYGLDGGSNNLAWRRLEVTGDEREVVLQLLFVEDDRLVAKEVALKAGKNARLLEWLSQGAEIGGGKLMLHRPTLSRALAAISNANPELRDDLVNPGDLSMKRIEWLSDAICGLPLLSKGRGLPVYLSLALSIEGQPTTPILPLKKEAVAFSAKEAEIGYLPRFVQPKALRGAVGLRILGVDLGQRFAAAAALVTLGKKGAFEGERRPHRPLASDEEFELLIENRLSLKLDGEDGEPPARLLRAQEALWFAKGTVQRQNLVAGWLRRLNGPPGGHRSEEERGKQRQRVHEEVREHLAVEPGSTEPAWTLDPREIDRVLAGLPEGTGASLRKAAGALASKAVAALARPEREELLALLAAHDELARAAHRVVRHALAHPAALAAGLRQKRPRDLDARIGGLSFARLELLEEWLRYERKFATRGRREEPMGAERKRRLARGGEFMPWLRERVARVKRDRCKKIAALIIEAALGGPPSEAKGERPRPRADVIALEDLSRYRFAGDRSKRENGRLRQWSHREVFKWVAMEAELHGLVVAAVPAGYTSRFCSACGAPGARVDTVREEWLGQTWWRREVEFREKKGDHSLSAAKPGDVVVKGGGPEFVCAGCQRQGNADENAAANIAIRFLVPPAQVDPVYLRLERLGEGQWKATTSGAYKDRTFVEGEKQTFSVAEAAKRLRRAAALADVPDEDEDLSSSKVVRIFRDPSGRLFGDRWLNGGAFWPIVENRVRERLARRS